MYGYPTCLVTIARNIVGPKFSVEYFEYYSKIVNSTALTLLKLSPYYFKFKFHFKFNSIISLQIFMF